MIKTENEQKKRITLFAIIIAGEAIFFLPFVLARIFRPTLLLVFDISNVELGKYFAVYGIVALLSYPLGGPLADRYSARWLMTSALWLTALGGLLLATIPSSGVMIVIYGFWGFSTILLFWAAMIRATREWGGSGFQGRAFGWLEGGRGLTAALLGTLAFFIFSRLTTSSSTESLQSGQTQNFQIIILVSSVIVFLSGILIWKFVPNITVRDNKAKSVFSLQKIAELAGIPSVWLLSVIVICAYSGYKITDDFSLFAKDVFGYSEVRAAGIGTAALWIRGIVAIAIGYAADYSSRLKTIIVCFALSFSGGLFIWLGILNESTGLVLLNMLMIMGGVYAVRALYFAVFQEAGIPLKYTGTAVGIISLAGFTPDIFMGPWMGHFLDKYTGAQGHQYVFMLLALFSLAGLIASVLLKFWSARSS